MAVALRVAICRIRRARRGMVRRLIGHVRSRRADGVTARFVAWHGDSLLLLVLLRLLLVLFLLLLRWIVPRSRLLAG